MQSNRTFNSSQQFDETISRDITVSIKIQHMLIKLFKSASNVMNQDQLEGLSKIINNLENKQEDSLKSIESALFFLLSQIQILKQSKTLSIRQSDYEVLEQSLQKAESQVRKHIRVEQQLKLYLDGLEEKNQHLTKQLEIQQTKYNQLFQSMRSMHQQKKELEKKLKKNEEKTKGLPDKQKTTKGYKSTKLLSQSMNKNDVYSISMHKSKPTLLNHYYSRTKNGQKNSQKSFDKQAILPQRKTNKFKALNDQIDVNLSKNTFQQSKQINDEKQQFVPTQQDIRLFKQMTRTVQMKQAYKKPVRRLTKYKTEGKQGKEIKGSKQVKEERQYKSISQNEGKQFRSMSMYK